MKTLTKAIGIAALAGMISITFVNADHHKNKDKKEDKAKPAAEETASAEPTGDREGPGGPMRRGDRDGDRKPGGPGRSGGPGFEGIDANGDGKIAKAEFLAMQIQRADEIFARADADDDNSLTKEEASALAQRSQGGRPGGGAPGGPGGRPPYMGGGLAEMDADGDGDITLEEFLAAGEQRQKRFFEMLDTNGDGKISRQELEESAARMRERFRGSQGGDRARGEQGQGQGPRPDRPAGRPQRPPAE